MLKSPIKAGAQPDLQDREGSVELELNAATAEDSTTAPNYEDGHSSALYDPRASDPLKAGAENTWLWEIVSRALSQSTVPLHTFM